jgi:hypothetical protein
MMVDLFSPGISWPPGHMEKKLRILHHAAFQPGNSEVARLGGTQITCEWQPYGACWGLFLALVLGYRSSFLLTQADRLAIACRIGLWRMLSGVRPVLEDAGYPRSSSQCTLYIEHF